MSSRVVSSSLAIAGVFIVSTAAMASPEGADPAHTGSQGEPDCGACHFGGANPTAASGIELMQLAEQMVVGETYRFTFQVRDPEQQVGGFQVAVRDPDTGQSRGVLLAQGGQRLVQASEVDYLTHSTPLAAQPGDDTGQAVTHWTVEWKAETAGAIEFAIAAVAADGDNSPIGDNVYTFNREFEVD